MAEVVYIEINGNNIIVGVHSEDIANALLPQNHNVIEAEVEEPEGLVGLDASFITETLDKRPDPVDSTLAELQRGQLRRLSIELDLMVRLGEDTTAKQAEFDALKNTYQNPPP
ncbi:hypothetical protein [Winogradskyella luteola]|uniref:Uncharacterized protein n=1 Tax=Winogradskyella luteola TaxID=2828330 RepID=A0A9X1F9C8_9FLAO|nr:hypothetical protein [Winogradskyella luteola]MBV7268355.1 hypothetical protein [Winogradskyella luteola]